MRKTFRYSIIFAPKVVRIIEKLVFENEDLLFAKFQEYHVR